MNTRATICLLLATAWTIGCAPELDLADQDVTPGPDSDAGDDAGKDADAGGDAEQDADAPSDAGCTSPADCPDEMSECSDPTCDDGTCGAMSLRAGTACSQGKCNGNGQCVECLSNMDCDGGMCSAEACAPWPCDNGSQNGDETDVDCGGSCPPCESGKKCLSNADCQSGTCVAPDNLCL